MDPVPHRLVLDGAAGGCGVDASAESAMNVVVQQ
jgi:hypothetical protein